MKFNPKLIRGKDGGVEIRLSLSFTPEEAKSLDRIPDDPGVGFHNLRAEGDIYQKSDFYLCQLRIITSWIGMWYDEDIMREHAHRFRSQREAKINEAGRRKKERVRNKRNPQ